MVRFDEPSHTYTTEGGTQLTSVTTVIGNYKEKFDKEFWSIYKAAERVITNEESYDSWLALKKELTPKGVVNSYKQETFNKHYQYKIKSTIPIVISEWDYERDISCYNGTNFHKSKEDSLFNAGYSGKLAVFQGLDSTEMPKPIETLPDGVYPELTVWNNYYGIAGQADLVTIYTIDGVRYVDIDDYKTNKKIDVVSFFNPKTKRYKRMNSPLQQVNDCNFEHYQLQISTYAYFLECFGLTVRNLTFNHYTNIGTKSIPKYEHNKTYELDYVKENVLKMLVHYKFSNQ